MKKGYFKKALATGLAALSVMSVLAAGNITAFAAGSSVSANYEKTVTTVEIPDSVTAIGDAEFKDFTNLETVIIGKNVRSISPTAFIGCPNIKAFRVHPENEYFRADNYKYLTTNYLNASEMKKLIRVATGEIHREGKRYEIPSYICEIGEYAFESAFSGDRYLEELLIDKDVVKIDSHAFDGCQIKSVITGKNVRYIDSFAFAGNKLIESIDLTYNLNAVGDFVFEGCDSLKTVIAGNRVMFIGLDPFAGAEVKVSTTKEIIAFDVNGGDYLAIPDNILFEVNTMQKQLISANKEPVKKGCTFNGWVDLEEHYYRINSRLKDDRSTVLFAVWDDMVLAPAGKSAPTYVISGGSSVNTETTVLDHGAAQKNENNTKKKYAVIGAGTDEVLARLNGKSIITANPEKPSENSQTDTAESTAPANNTGNSANVDTNESDNSGENTVIPESTTGASKAENGRDGGSAETGKKLSVFERIIAFFRSIFGKKG